MASRPAKKSILNMNGGLWSSKLDGRIDLEKYSSACRRADNFIIRPFGMMERRPGTKFIARTKNNAAAELWKFQFDTDTGYIIEVGEQYMRFFKDGAMIIRNDLAVNNVVWSSGTGPGGEDEATYTVAGTHNLAPGDRVTVDIIAPTGYRVTDAIVLQTPSGSTFTVESADYGAYTTPGGLHDPYEVFTTYGAADIAGLQPRQINDVVIITSPTEPISILKRITTTTFEFDEIILRQPPFRDENLSDIQLSCNNTTGASRTLTASATAWTNGVFYPAGIYRQSGTDIYLNKVDHTSSALFATDAANWDIQAIFTTDNVDGYFRLGHRREATNSEQQIWDQGTAAGVNGTSTPITILGGWTLNTDGVWSADIEVERIDAITGVTETIYKGSARDGNRNISRNGSESQTTQLQVKVSNSVTPTAVGAADAYAYLEASDAFIHGYVKVTGYTDATHVTVDVIDDLQSTAATDVWAESSWSPRRGFPASCDLYEQRLVFAGCTDEPLKVWGSVIGDFYNFFYGDSNDDQAFQYNIPATEQNPIQWIVGGKSILVGNGKEYGIMSSGSDDLPITPSNVRYRPSEAVGFNSIKPQVIGPIFAGVERNGRRLREIAYKFDEGVSGGYKAADLNRLNDDISESGIIDISYAQLREPYIYAVMDNGDMGCLSYNRDDGVVGWTNWTTSGDYEAVATIRGTDNDEVWIIRKEDSNNRFIERVHPDTWEFIDECWYLDSAVKYTGGATTVFTGLEHLEGEAVEVFGDGAPRTIDETVSSVVSNGAITITDSVSTAIIGKRFISNWKPMRLDVDAQGSSQGSRKSISHLSVRVHLTQTFKIWNGVKSDTVPFNQTIDTMGVAIQAFTGEKHVNWASTYGSTGQNAKATDNDPELLITQDLPLPLNLIAVIVNYKISG